jgi:hypothetical protein
MKKLVSLHVLAVLLATAALVLVSAPARAYVYDDFNGTGINTSLWEDRNTAVAYFSQPGDGFLHFYSGGNLSNPTYTSDILRTPSRVGGAFFVAMHYSESTTTNDITGEFNGSGPVLWIGDSNKMVRLYYYATGSVSGIWGIERVGTQNTDGGWVYTPRHLTTAPFLVEGNYSSGWLGIGYDGTNLSLSYKGDEPSSVWQELYKYSPGFANDPYFAIEGYNPDPDGMLSFKVDQVQLNPVPLPPSALLLGTGLLGLLGLKRKTRRG